ncbi:MAG: rRNA adenine N-6-methyltransferase family protein, partial [Actinomycetota bacterium]
MAVRRGTERDRRQRSLGQNFLVDRRLIDRFVASLDLTAEQLVVDIGAGTGALTVPMAEAGARVLAVEADPRLA